jgi:hypothetical protein
MSCFQSQPDGFTMHVLPLVRVFKVTLHRCRGRVFKANPMALPRGARWAKLTAPCKGRVFKVKGLQSQPDGLPHGSKGGFASGFQSQPDGFTTLSGCGSGDCLTTVSGSTSF